MGYLLNTDGLKDTLVSATPPADEFVSWNFERFDGLDLALDAAEADHQSAFVEPRAGKFGFHGRWRAGGPGSPAYGAGV